MRLIIDIPDEEYEDVKKAGGCYYDFGKAIYYGIPIPKDHGRLVDADRAIQVLHDGVFGKFDNKPQWSNVGVSQLMKNLPTIVEATEK